MGGYVLRRLAPHLDTIVQLYQRGQSFHDIAARFDCAPSTIRRLLVSQEIPLWPPVRKSKLDHVEGEVLRAYAAGEDIGEIARRHQVRRQTVLRFLFARKIDLYRE